MPVKGQRGDELFAFRCGSLSCPLCVLGTGTETGLSLIQLKPLQTGDNLFSLENPLKLNYNFTKEGGDEFMHNGLTFFKKLCLGLDLREVLQA